MKKIEGVGGGKGVVAGFNFPSRRRVRSAAKKLLNGKVMFT